MKQIRKKVLDKATESVLTQAANAGIPLAFDRYEEMSPVCRFGQMGLDCKACTQGPCRVNPFDPSNGTTCGRDREGIVAASFLALIADGAAASASYAGSTQAAGTIFGAMVMANEGNASSARMLQKALEVAGAGYRSLPSEPSGAIRESVAGLGALQSEKMNVLLVGSMPADQARSVASQLSGNEKVNLVSAAGGEVSGASAAGSYNSAEVLVASTAVDAIVAGRACVSPGLLSLAARQGVPVQDVEAFDMAALLEGADRHFRLNQGRNLAAKFAPAKALVGFSASSFQGVSPARWSALAAMGVKGVALLGGCNNVVVTQDAAVVRQAQEFLARDVLVVASGCAATALAKAGYMDPSRMEAQAGKAVASFLGALSGESGVALPAVLEAGTCWEIPVAVELAAMLARLLGVPMVAAMPELSRPAAWASALAIAARGVPTYVGPILPLDGGLQTLDTLNELLKTEGGALLGPGQVSSPEAVAGLIV